MELRKKRNSTIRSAAEGKPSILKPVEQDLLQFIFELHEQGIGVAVAMVMNEACHLIPCLWLKTRKAQVSIVCRFIRKHNFVHCCVTHKSQKLSAEMEEEAIEFVHRMKEYLDVPNRNKDFILNMDQTAVYYSSTPRTTINL